ncbi:MAG: sporulation protein YqfD [Clostridia bacterium]|nr:sporulation protein YqfD [Clostridia bacterium]
MTDLTGISIICTTEAALKKLKKEGVAAYSVKKDGAKLVFYVKDKDVEKVFAIFDKPCYNVKVIKKSRRKRLAAFLSLRAGLVAGALLFIAAAVIANEYVLKIEVGGSGSYLEPEIRRIIEDEGAGEFKRLNSFNGSVATGRILALPQVTFCNIQKRGSVLFIDVQTDSEHYGSADRKNLLSDVDGTVRNIVAICGTAAVQAGDKVKKGGALIYAHTLAGEEQIGCLAAGYAEIECRRTVEYFAEEESEQSLKAALASTLIDEENILSRKHAVKPAEGGVVYVIDFTYLHRLSINLE